MQECQKIATDEQAVQFCKRVSSGEIKAPFSKATWIELIEFQAAANFPDPALSKQQKFSKYLGTPVGLALYRASKAAPAEAAASAADRHVDFLKSAEKLDGADYAKARAELDGPNHARLHSMAIQMQREQSGMSYAHAFSRVFTDPAHATLANGAKD